MKTTCSIGVSPGTIVPPSLPEDPPAPVPPLGPVAGEVPPEGPVVARSSSPTLEAHPSAATAITSTPMKTAKPRRRAARRLSNRSRLRGIGTREPGPEGALMAA
jgi:hypothetical protein